MFFPRARGTQLECCCAASRRRCRWLTSKMDFRSNEAGRIAPWELNRQFQAEPISARSTFAFPLKPPVVAVGASSSTMKIQTLSVDFTDEQKRYLEGFATGLQISRVGRGLGGANAGKANAEPSGPDAAHIRAQDKVIASGKKLVDQEKFKREQHPFDAYPRLKQLALDNAAPTPADNFRWRYYGLFYFAPAQYSYMCRLRIPNGIPKHRQMSGTA